MERTLGGIDLVNIIKTCAECGVESFEYSEGKVNIKFVNQTKVVEQVKIDTPDAEAPGPVITSELTDEQHRQIAMLQEEEWLENLKLTNPFRYEEMLARRELKDVQDEQDNRGFEPPV